MLIASHNIAPQKPHRQRTIAKVVSLLSQAFFTISHSFYWLYLRELFLFFTQLLLYFTFKHFLLTKLVSQFVSYQIIM